MTDEVADLPRTASGMPVVYITQYLPADRSAPDPEFPDFDAPGGVVLDCRCTFGRGRPLIGKQCPHRQRKAMLERRCNVCGQRVKVGYFAGVTRVGDAEGRAGWACLEAPSHASCLAYSALTCPHMLDIVDEYQIATTDGDYGLLDRWMVGPNEHDFFPHGWPRQELAPRRWTGALDLHLAMLPGNVERRSLDEWMHVVAPEPYRSLWTAL